MLKAHSPPVLLGGKNRPVIGEVRVGADVTDMLPMNYTNTHTHTSDLINHFDLTGSVRGLILKHNTQKKCIYTYIYTHVGW